jgi:hypothetical protein
MLYTDPSGYETCEDQDREDDEDECEEENRDDSDEPINDPSAPWEDCPNSQCPPVNVGGVDDSCASVNCTTTYAPRTLDLERLRNWANSVGLDLITIERGRLFGCTGELGVQSYYGGCGIVVGQSASLKPKLSPETSLDWTNGVPEGIGGRIGLTVPFYSWSIFFNSSGIEVSSGFRLTGGTSFSATAGYRGEW